MGRAPRQRRHDGAVLLLALAARVRPTGSPHAQVPAHLRLPTAIHYVLALAIPLGSNRVEEEGLQRARLHRGKLFFLATMMPWQVAVGSITLSGFLVGALVSATHQSEEIMEFGENPRFQAAEDALGVARRAELPFHVLWILTKLHDFFALVRRTHESADEETTERDRADSHLPRHHRRQEEIVCPDAH